MVGWHVRNLKFVKRLKSLSEYLKPALPPAKQRDRDARQVKALFKRKQSAQARKGKQDGSR